MALKEWPLTILNQKIEEDPVKTRFPTEDFLLLSELEREP